MLGNQFGIDVDRILQSGSTLKTAKLRRNALQRNMDRQDMEDEAYGNFISKDSPQSVVQAIDTDNDGRISAEEERQGRIKTGQKYNALSNIENRTEKRIDRKQIRANRTAAAGRAATRFKWAQADRANAEAKLEADIKNASSIFQSMGVKKPIADLYAKAGAVKVKKIGESVAKMDEAQTKVLSTTMKKEGMKYIKQVQEFDSLKSVEEQIAYSQNKEKEMLAEKKELSDKAAQAYKANDNELGDMYTEQEQDIPNKFDVNYPKQKLVELNVLQNYLESIEDAKLTMNQKEVRREKKESANYRSEHNIGKIVSKQLDNKMLYKESDIKKNNKKIRAITLKAQHIKKNNPGISDMEAVDMAMRENKPMKPKYKDGKVLYKGGDKYIVRGGIPVKVQ